MRKRKIDHLKLALRPEFEASGGAGFQNLRLLHSSLPELDWEEVDLSAEILGQKRKTPFYVAGMTAGPQQAWVLNHKLAQACEKKGWILGLGSLRADLESSDSKKKKTLWLEFRKHYPELFLIANIGAVQLKTDLSKVMIEWMNDIGFDALAIHLNPLQEALQPEGQLEFAGVANRIADLVRKQDFPILLKETGSGIDAPMIPFLKKIAPNAVDLSGFGGTHWGRIEGARNLVSDWKKDAAVVFQDWGIGTVPSLLEIKRSSLKMEVWASGGIRTGLDAAKSLALGASAVGYAKPALFAAQNGLKNCLDWMQGQENQLRLALFLTGSRDLKSLEGKFQWIK